MQTTCSPKKGASLLRQLQIGSQSKCNTPSLYFIRARKSTLVYTHLIAFETDAFTFTVAKTAEDTCQLMEAGFEYVCTTPDALMLPRKRL